MNCKKCWNNPVKNGLVKSTGKQRYLCKNCNYSFLDSYIRKSFEPDINERLVILLKESCGIRSIARILEISPKTVIVKIKQIASSIIKPPILFGRDYEMDEMYTYIGNKKRRICWIFRSY